MNEIRPAIACNLDVDILAAALPLLQEERVAAMEWAFDTLFKVKEVPEWFYELLTAFSNEGRLTGHGVFFSLFSGKWQPQQDAWLQHLRRLCHTFSFDHITEHFGFMTGSDFHNGAPLSIPYNATTLAIGRDRLARIQEACQCAVGLENLAFSYSLDEVKRHGVFLDELMEPINGFIILDLHNLYCQLHNFSMSYEALIALYPLERVREIHISGGSWAPFTIAPQGKVRRDTHDDGVPDQVFEMLALTLPKCPNLKYVVMEQLGTGLKSAASRKLFYDDFIAMEAIVVQHNNTTKNRLLNPFLPAAPIVLNPEAVEDVTLQQQQAELSLLLETAGSYESVKEQLSQSSLAHTDWKVENWSPYMLETARCIAQKWKKG